MNNHSNKPKCNNVIINETALINMHICGWSIAEIEESFINNEQVYIYDADMHRVFMTINGKRAEMDVDGNIEYLDD